MKIVCCLAFNLLIAAAFSQQQISVYFDFNKYDLTTGSVGQLDSLLLSNINTISLSGYCDATGSHPYNDQLSLNRIKTVKTYLINKGISKTFFIQETGFGKRKPVNDNATAGRRLLNRRVDLFFTVGQMAVEKDVTKILTVDTTAISLLETKLKDNSIKPGDNIVLKQLNFIGGRHVLLRGSELFLEELLEILKKYPSLKIEIQGHICCMYNGMDGLDFDTRTNTLSVNRAKAVYDYLIEHGIDVSRLAYKGFGSTHPLFYPERDEDEKTANRRVEIKIIAK